MTPAAPSCCCKLPEEASEPHLISPLTAAPPAHSASTQSASRSATAPMAPSLMMECVKDAEIKNQIRESCHERWSTSSHRDRLAAAVGPTLGAAAR